MRYILLTECDVLILNLCRTNMAAVNVLPPGQYNRITTKDSKRTSVYQPSKGNMTGLKSTTFPNVLPDAEGAARKEKGTCIMYTGFLAVPSSFCAAATPAPVTSPAAPVLPAAPYNGTSLARIRAAAPLPACAPLCTKDLTLKHLDY